MAPLSEGASEFFFRLITGWIPSLLLACWNAIVIPFVLCWSALLEASAPSLSGQDLRVFKWYYIYNVFNVLLGGMLAGTIFSQLVSECC